MTPVITAEQPGHDHGGRPPAAPAEGSAAAVAAGFAADWVADRDPVTWLQRLQAWCEPGLAQALATADPANVPASAVTGPPTKVDGSAEEGLRMRVDTDAGSLVLTMAATDGHWLVSGVDFVRRAS
ncbi:hypothetical protein [Catellatospora sp. NPDC049133]|uniref:hypothetical protein n=1 Tax=Catellatospora sp. NPDC049133 TaxID=3155499 RepID=UPI0033E4629C